MPALARRFTVVAPDLLELFQPPPEDVVFKAGPLPTTSKPSR